MTVPPAAQDSDAALIEGSLTDPESFAALFDRYSAMLYRYVSRRLGPEAAEDVVGESFLVAFSKRHRYDLAQRPEPPGVGSGPARRGCSPRSRRHERTKTPSMVKTP